MRKTISASEGSSIYLLAICAGTVLSLFLSLALSKTSASLDGMSVYAWCGYAVMQIGFLGVVFCYAKARKLDLVHISGLKTPPDLRSIALLPLVAIATILVFLPLANAWTSLLSIMGYPVEGAVSMPDYSNVGIYFLSLLVMAIIPAIGEELLMRGNVFKALSTRGLWFGVLMSGLFFSLMHANPLQTVHQFGLGVVLALTMAITRSVWTCVIVHFLNNFISITLTAYLPVVDEWYVTLGAYNWLVGFFSVIVGLILLVTALYLLYRIYAKKSDGVSSVYEEDGYVIVATSNFGSEKQNGFKAFACFFKGLFTKSGWRRITYALEERNEVEYLGKAQNMLGVWIALVLVVVYWLYAFIVGLL